MGRLPFLILAVVFLSACGSAPKPVEQTQKDTTTESWYNDAVTQLTAIDRQAEAAFKAGDQDKAAALIEKGQALQVRLLEAHRPTLAAMEAVSDLDQLYGNMLLTNKNYGWARMFFQKNLARWKHFPDQNDETAQRVKLAEDGIAACDRKIMQ